MEKIHDPAYWLKEIEEGRAGTIETGPTKDRPGRNDRVIARLAELDTKRQQSKMTNQSDQSDA